MAAEITERFVAQCSPAIDTSYDTTGTVTRSTMDHLTATDLASIFTPGGLFADLDAWFLHSIEMAACGIKRNALYDWIMANADRTQMRAAMTEVKIAKSASLLQPFIFGKQETVINKDHWRVRTGWVQSGYTALTTGPLSASQLSEGSASDRVIRVESRHDVPVDAKFFNASETLHIFAHAANNVAQDGHWKILAAAASSDLTYCDVLLTSLNAGSTGQYDTAPTDGYVIKGVNNVNDFENWCNNKPTLDPRKRVPFWLQTMRMTRTTDSEYLKVYSRLMTSNPAFREFGDLPMAERNKQDEELFQREFVNAFFFNKPISANQTVDLWESLETINTVAGAVLDPGLSGKPIAKRANFVGVVEQLRACNRVFDMHGIALNLYEFLDLNYNIGRARKTAGKVVKELDWWTNSTYKATMATAFMAYYNAEYLDQFRVTADLGKTSELGFDYDGYMVKRPAGIKINILCDEFFDDWYDENDAANHTNMGNILACLNIGKPGAGSIYWAMCESNRKVHRTADIEQLAQYDSTYRCTMETVSVETTLVSNTGTVVVETPLESAWIWNMPDTQPSLVQVTSSFSDLY